MHQSVCGQALRSKHKIQYRDNDQATADPEQATGCAGENAGDEVQ